MERVIITIDQDGNPTIKVEGHHGPGCKSLTKAIELAMGSVKSDKNTNEFFLPVSKVSNHVKN